MTKTYKKIITLITLGLFLLPNKVKAFEINQLQEKKLNEDLIKTNVIEFFQDKKITIEDIKIIEYYEVIEKTPETKYPIKKISLYEKASENSENITSINKDEKIIVLGETTNNWLKVTYNEKTGFIKKTTLLNEPFVSKLVQTAEASNFTYMCSENYKNLGTADSYFNRIPNNIKNFLQRTNWNIFFTTENIAQTEFYGMYNSVMGVTIFDRKIIKIEDREKAIRESVYHEVGHAIDWSYDTNYYYHSQTAEFREIFRTEAKKSLSLPGTSNHTVSTSEEYFAECVNQIITNELNFYLTCPSSYNYLVNIINSL